MGMIKKTNKFIAKSVLLIVNLNFIIACAPIVSNITDNLARNLSDAVLNQEDPKIVRDGAPAYLLLLDSLVAGNPENPVILSSASDLYTSYSAIFVNDANRSKILSERALKYSKKALCISYEDSCNWDDYSFDDFNLSLDDFDMKYSDLLLTYSTSYLVYIRSHSNDWNAIARLPYIESALEYYVEKNPETENIDSVYTYLGILSTLLPPALGGDYEKGKRYFENAIEFSGDQNLSAKVEYALSYARPLYDRELHDKLLQEVISSNPVKKNYTLLNVIAKEQASSMLEDADEYF
jgi:hypothetical protein|tara:strand:- start:13 stop:894 length:882 start_codon:yes stop_codon:yes gene_type:complete